MDHRLVAYVEVSRDVGFKSNTATQYASCGILKQSNPIGPWFNLRTCHGTQENGARVTLRGTDLWLIGVAWLPLGGIHESDSKE